MVDRRGRDPGTLLIDAEHVAGEVRAEATRRAHAGHHGDELAVLAEDTAPTAPRRLVVRVVAHVHVERDPELAESVALGAISITVIGTGNVPARTSSEVFVGDAVAIRVTQARGLGALGDEQVLAVAQQAEGLMQAGGEELVTDLVRLGIEDAVEHPDLALANRERELSVGGPVHAADFEREAVTRLPILGARIEDRTRGQDIGDVIGRRGKRGGGKEGYDRGFHFQR